MIKLQKSTELTCDLERASSPQHTGAAPAPRVMFCICQVKLCSKPTNQSKFPPCCPFLLTVKTDRHPFSSHLLKDLPKCLPGFIPALLSSSFRNGPYGKDVSRGGYSFVLCFWKHSCCGPKLPLWGRNLSLQVSGVDMRWLYAHRCTHAMLACKYETDFQFSRQLKLFSKHAP